MNIREPIRVRELPTLRGIDPVPHFGPVEVKLLMRDFRRVMDILTPGQLEALGGFNIIPHQSPSGPF